MSAARARRRIVLVTWCSAQRGSLSCGRWRGVQGARMRVAPATLRLKSHEVSKKSRDVGKWAIIAINSRNESSSFLFGLSRQLLISFS